MPDVDQAPTGCRQSVRVAGAMRAQDQDVARKAISMRQGRHLRHVPARDRCRRRERQRRGRAGRDQSRLGSGRFGDAGAGGILQLADINRGARGRSHRLDNFRRHDRTAQPSQCASGIDAAANAEACIGIAHEASLARLAKPSQ
jgi:hypothetical protein